MQKLVLYAKALWRHWWAFMSCAAFTFVSIILAFVPSEKANSLLIEVSVGLAILFFVVASYRAWLDEHDAILEKTKFIDEQLSGNRPRLHLDYFEPSHESEIIGMRAQESELWIRNGSRDHEAFDIKLEEFVLGEYKVVSHYLKLLNPKAMAPIQYSVGVWESGDIFKVQHEYLHNIKALLNEEFFGKHADGTLTGMETLSVPMRISYKNADGTRFETEFMLQTAPQITPLFHVGASRKI